MTDGEPQSENPSTLCARDGCRHARRSHSKGGCSACACTGFVYDSYRDMMDYYEGAHGPGIGQDSARRMMWGD